MVLLHPVCTAAVAADLWSTLSQHLLQSMYAAKQCFPLIFASSPLAAISHTSVSGDVNLPSLSLIAHALTLLFLTAIHTLTYGRMAMGLSCPSFSAPSFAMRA
eukprot:2938522-Heterocapsa_arctica.AAC.1